MSPSYRSASIQFLFGEFSEVPNALQNIIGGRENETQCLLLRRTHLKRSTKKDQEKANHVDLLLAVCS